MPWFPIRDYEVEKMDDDIELPPLPNYSEWLCDEIRKWGERAILADRQKREKPEKPERKVHRVPVSVGNWYGSPTYYMGRPDDVGAEGEQHRFVIAWHGGRAWICSERNAELAAKLRRYYLHWNPPSQEHADIKEAADALDGGNPS